MAWWIILLIVLGSIAAAVLLLFILLFLVYFFNVDSKMLVHVQKWLQRFYNKRERDRHLE